MFRVKICGVRTKADVDVVSQCSIRLGGQEQAAVGLNFFPKSVRYVDPIGVTAGQLASYARSSGILAVGLFVNQQADMVAKVAQRLNLDVVQIHGDESPTEVERIRDAIKDCDLECGLLRAVKLPRQALTTDLISSQVKPWIDLGCGLLFDADAGSAHGGMGIALDWKVISEWALQQASQNPQITWTLAGGLNPDNVADAMKASSASSVDVASGVESPRGVKSPSLIEAFFRAVDGA